MFIAVPTIYSLKSDQTEVLAKTFSQFCQPALDRTLSTRCFVSQKFPKFSPLNSIVVERVGNLNEHGLPVVQLTEDDEDSMNAISVDKLPAHTR